MSNGVWDGLSANPTYQRSSMQVSAGSQALTGVGAAIITESALSFLGLGFPSDIPTWGRMLYEAKDRFEFSPHQAIFPGLMIFLTVLSINYIGDGLRDALDPRKTQ